MKQEEAMNVFLEPILGVMPTNLGVIPKTLLV